MLQFIKDYAETIVALFSVLSSIGYVVNRFLIRPFKDFIGNLAKNVDSIKSTTEKHSAILKELQPNGGGSMKDKVEAANTKLKNIDSMILHIKNLSLSQLDLVNYPIWKSDNEGENVFINESYKELFEVDFQNSRGYKWTSLIHEEDLDVYMKKWKDTLTYKKDTQTTARFVTQRTKKVLNCKVIWKVVTDVEDEILYILGRIFVIE